LSDIEKKVFQLERKRIERDRLKRILDEDLFEVVEEVFDLPTLFAVYELANEGIIGVMHGVVSTGKEARIYWAESPKGEDLAVKIFLIATAEFRRGRMKYIEGDPRFKRIRRDPRHLIYTWCSKEYRNLKLAYEVGVPVPKPIRAYRNVLVMEFINTPGERGKPAPLIKDLPPENPEKGLNEILNYIYKLYNDAELVHADLSEYNIMNQDDKLIIIDWGSAVKISHPMADEFLLRDIENVIRFFRKLGVDTPNPKEVYDWIKGL